MLYTLKYTINPCKNRIRFELIGLKTHKNDGSSFITNARVPSWYRFTAYLQHIKWYRWYTLDVMRPIWYFVCAILIFIFTQIHHYMLYLTRISTIFKQKFPVNVVEIYSAIYHTHPPSKYFNSMQSPNSPQWQLYVWNSQIGVNLYKTQTFAVCWFALGNNKNIFASISQEITGSWHQSSWKTWKIWTTLCYRTKPGLIKTCWDGSPWHQQQWYWRRASEVFSHQDLLSYERVLFSPKCAVSNARYFKLVCFSQTTEMNEDMRTACLVEVIPKPYLPLYILNGFRKPNRSISKFSILRDTRLSNVPDIFPRA